jgi:excisionase family DNA binding protein
VSEALLAGALEELVERIARRVVELQRELDSDGEREQRSPWLSVKTAAAYLGWPRQRLYKLTARGEIPHYKQERRLAFRRDELERWLERYAEGERDWMRAAR